MLALHVLVPIGIYIKKKKKMLFFLRNQSIKIHSLHWTPRTYLLPEIKANWHGFLPLRQLTQSSLMMVILPLSLLSWLHFSAALELRCRTRVRVQTQARRIMMMMLMMMMKKPLRLAPFLVHASFACACAYWLI